MAQLWQGRFSKAVDSRVNDFNSSIRFDQRIGRTFYVDPFLRKEIRNGGNAYFELLRNL